MPQDTAQQKYACRDRTLYRTSFTADKIGQGKRQQNTRKNQKCNGSSHRRNGDEGGHKGSNNTADSVKSAQRSHNLAAVFQTLHRIFRQRRRHRPQQKQRKHEDHHTRRKCRPDQEVRIDRKNQQRGDSQNHIFARHRNCSDPDCGDQNPAVEPVRIGVLVRTAAAVYIPQRHGDHDRSYDNRPHDLGRTEIRRQQPAGAQFYCHHRHTREELRQIEKQFIF